MIFKFFGKGLYDLVNQEHSTSLSLSCQLMLISYIMSCLTFFAIYI